MTIDPEFLGELDRFETALDRETTAIQQGSDESPLVGEGLTFSDYRRYSPGDDVRLIDWKLYARTEEYFIKQFEEERNLTVHLLVDASASMAPETGADKFEYAAKLALGVAYLTAEEYNDFRFGTFAEAYERLDGGRSNRGELLDLIESLNATAPAGETDFERVLRTYADRLRERSLVVVVTDALADPDVIEDGVTALARNDADVLLVRVLTPEERDPDAVGDTRFVDPETAESKRSYFSPSLARQYRDRLDAHIEAVSSRVRSLEGEHVLVNTGDDYFDSFAEVWFS